MDKIKEHLKYIVNYEIGSIADAYDKAKYWATAAWSWATEAKPLRQCTAACKGREWACTKQKRNYSMLGLSTNMSEQCKPDDPEHVEKWHAMRCSSWPNCPQEDVNQSQPEIKPKTKCNQCCQEFIVSEGHTCHDDPFGVSPDRADLPVPDSPCGESKLSWPQDTTPAATQLGDSESPLPSDLFITMLKYQTEYKDIDTFAHRLALNGKATRPYKFAKVIYAHSEMKRRFRQALESLSCSPNANTAEKVIEANRAIRKSLKKLRECASLKNNEVSGQTLSTEQTKKVEKRSVFVRALVVNLPKSSISQQYKKWTASFWKMYYRIKSERDAKVQLNPNDVLKSDDEDLCGQLCRLLQDHMRTKGIFPESGYIMDYFYSHMPEEFKTREECIENWFGSSKTPLRKSAIKKVDNYLEKLEKADRDVTALQLNPKDVLKSNDDDLYRLLQEHMQRRGILPERGYIMDYFNYDMPQGLTREECTENWVGSSKTHSRESAIKKVNNYFQKLMKEDADRVAASAGGDVFGNCTNCKGESTLSCSACFGCGSLRGAPLPMDGSMDIQKYALVDCPTCKGKGRWNCDECDDDGNAFPKADWEALQQQLSAELTAEEEEE